MSYSGARDTLIHEKKLKSKISFQTPYKYSNGIYNYCCSWRSLVCILSLLLLAFLLAYPSSLYSGILLCWRLFCCYNKCCCWRPFCCYLSVMFLLPQLLANDPTIVDIIAAIGGP